jgi:hypothetical protein
MQKYREALAAFAAPGGRWANAPAFSYWGKAAGLTADELIADARAAGVVDRDADIRRGWNDARPKYPDGKPTGHYHAPRTAKPTPPPKYPAHVRSMCGEMDAEKGEVDWVRELSPDLDWLSQPPEAQTAAFIRAAFRPDERLFVFRGDVGTRGVPGVNLRTAADWLTDVGAIGSAGDLVKTNPFTGAVGRTTGGQPSFVSQDCLAGYPFALLEFDSLPLAAQYGFWRTFVMCHALAPALVSLTHSGGKSVHGLLHVGCRTLTEWQRVRARLVSLFAADADARFRIDPQALHPLIGTRLPGVRRRGNGALQRLIYLNPEARSVNGWNAPDGVPGATAKGG